MKVDIPREFQRPNHFLGLKWTTLRPTSFCGQVSAGSGGKPQAPLRESPRNQRFKAIPRCPFSGAHVAETRLSPELLVSYLVLKVDIGSTIHPRPGRTICSKLNSWVTQVLVCVSIYQGAKKRVHLFEPQPHGGRFWGLGHSAFGARQLNSGARTNPQTAAVVVAMAGTMRPATSFTFKEHAEQG